MLPKAYRALFPHGFWFWYTNDFVRGFCSYWPLLLLFVLPIAMLIGAVGSEFGPKYLFFHDEWSKELVAGGAVALLLMAVLFAGYIVALRDRRARRLNGKPPQRFLPYALAIVVCLGATVLGLVLLIALCAVLFRVFAGPTDPLSSASTAESLSAKQMLVFGGGALATWLAFWLATRGRRLARFLDRMLRKLRHLEAISLPPAGQKARRICCWVFGVSAALIWIILLAALVRASRQDTVRYVGPLGLVVFGVASTIGAVCWPSKTWPFRIALGSHLLLAYAAVSWCLSSCPWGLLAAIVAALGCGVLVSALVWAFFPERLGNALGAVGKWAKMLRPRERRAVGLAVLGLPIIYALLLAAGLIRYIASPIPLIMLLLFSVAVAYGLIAWAFRHSAVVLLTLVAFLACISHIQPYQMRFPGMRYDDDAILDLHAQTGREVRRQEEFNSLLDEYRNASEDVKGYAGNVNLLTTAQQDDKLGTADETLKASTDQRNKLAQKLQALWRTMEEENYVRAGRLLSATQSDPAVQKLNLQQGRRNPDGTLRDESLLPIDEVAVWGPPEENRPLVVICVSGGGIRAAVWTFAVLKKLEIEFAKRKVDFPAHVRIITGASGGIVGASYYVGTLPHPVNRPSWQQRESDLTTQQKQLASDFLTPIFRRAVLSDFPCWLSPWVMKHDRGQALEQAWGDSFQSGFGAITFDALRDGEKQGWRPSLVVSPMMIEDGRRLLISNLDLRFPISHDGMVRTQEPTAQELENHSIEALELFRLFPDARKTFKVASAARMSASFPYFSPAVSLPTVPRRRVVDAGYYDNFGVSLASSWLFVASNERWIQNNFKRVLFIQIRDSTTEKDRQLRSQTPDDSSFWRRALEELTSPGEGLYNARTSSSSFRNDGELALLDKYRRESGKSLPEWRDSKFLVFNFELGANASLSWYLSEYEKQLIRCEADKLARRNPEDVSIQDAAEADCPPEPDSGDTVRRFDDLFAWWFR
jgi:predicted acylesterase/phospholipase RssA